MQIENERHIQIFSYVKVRVFSPISCYWRKWSQNGGCDTRQVPLQGSSQLQRKHDYRRCRCC